MAICKKNKYEYLKTFFAMHALQCQNRAEQETGDAKLWYIWDVQNFENVCYTFGGGGTIICKLACIRFGSCGVKRFQHRIFLSGRNAWRPSSISPTAYLAYGSAQQARYTTPHFTRINYACKNFAKNLKLHVLCSLLDLQIHFFVMFKIIMFVVHHHTYRMM